MANDEKTTCNIFLLKKNNQGDFIRIFIVEWIKKSSGAARKREERRRVHIICRGKSRQFTEVCMKEKREEMKYEDKISNMIVE